MDYQVADSQRLPAELLLAMLHTATQIALPATPIEMQRLQLSAPQLLSEPDQEIIVNLTPQADGSITAIVGQSTNQPWLQATIQTNAASAEQRVALEPILARCSNQATLSQQSNGVSYGPAYAGLERIVWNDSEALGYYTLDPFQPKQLGKTAFTPAHGAIMLRLASEFHQRHGLASEFRKLGSVQIVADCPAEGLVYLKRAGNSNHLAILDHSGRVYAKFQGLSTHSEATPVQALPAPSTSQAPSDAEQILERFFYAPRWQPTLANAQSTPQVGKLVIIASAESQALVSALCANQTAAINLIWLDSTLKHPTIPTWLVRSNDPNALSHALAAIGSIDSIYLLSGLEQASTTFDLGHFEQQQERGVLSLFRLLKALQEQQLLDQELSLKIITANTNHVVANDQVQPFAASMFGLAKSAAREYRRLRIACIDLEQHDLAPETVAATAAFIHGEAPLAPLQEVAQRQGQRYQRILEPVKLAPSNLAFRKGGVYMVLGGAGNVGFKLCCYLAEQCQAKVVITGRRAITPAIEAQLQSIEERGGRAIYIAADMSDLDSMRSAVATTKQHFGGLHGVFHSAMSFEYTPLNGLTEAQLYQDLAPKARGSVVLHHALVDEALDFKLYFSSGEAFTGNIGWGSYAAGCTFEDAFAHAERAQVNYPVQVINWGFWESERDQYLDALKAKGINPIETAIGMQAVSRVVAAGIPQVMALNVADKVLELMGVVLPKPNVASATPAISQAATPIPAAATPPVAPVAVPLVTSQPVAANPQNQREQLYGYILGQLAAVLKIDPSRIDVTSELTNYGVDSLVVTDIHKRFEQDLGSMPVTLLLENTTVAAIANFLQQDYADRVAAFFSPMVAATVTSQATSNTHEQLIDTADLFALEVGSNQPSSATQPPTAPASITLLRQIEPAAIASELDRYGDQYAQKLFPAWKQNGGSLVNLTELDANPQLLKHLLVNVADKTQAEVWMIGNGPPLVLIPAIGLTAPVWINQIQQWAADYRVIVIHQQGYGMTDLTSDISTAAVAKLFISTLDQLGINRPCHVIGSCFGGVAAQYLTQAYPERVCSLTLCGTFNKNFGLPDIDVSELTIDQMIEGAKMIGSSINRDFDAVAEGLASDQAQPIVEQARSLLLKSQCVSPLVVMRYITQILTLNGQAWLPRIQAPTLCLSGNLDTIVAPETSRTISQQIPAGRYIEIPGAGHYPFLTHVDLFEQAVRPFLREQEAQLMSTLV
uniref:SphH n=1 Tax=Herpetosiphon sp. B060 TaxID=2002978 RepID=A0A2Z2H057_9CHLR|nr:SphH [Herpetosiphon sp. B060]